VGRDRHGAARYALGADHGQQRHQRHRRWQQRGLQPHPAAAKVAAYALQLFNREIKKATPGQRHHHAGRASIQSAEEIFHHKDVALLCVTGPFVVRPP